MFTFIHFISNSFQRKGVHKKCHKNVCYLCGIQDIESIGVLKLTVFVSLCQQITIESMDNESIGQYYRQELGNENSPAIATLKTLIEFL
ncbi:unnamed protein product, partial [Oppiella nova]